MYVCLSYDMRVFFVQTAHKGRICTSSRRG